MPPGTDAGPGPERGARPGVPRWVKVGIIVLVILVLLVGILTIAGVHDPQPGGGHGL
jgi:hypothetical protein